MLQEKNIRGEFKYFNIEQGVIYFLQNNEKTNLIKEAKMKLKINIALLSFFIVFLNFACNNEIENQPPEFSGKLINHTDCKHLKSSISENNQSCVEYVFDHANNKLLLTHINTGFNCCPDSLWCTISKTGNKIIIEEFEASQGCKCNCLYDFKIEIEGVEQGKYTIQFIEPYRGEQEELIFEVDLSESSTGSFCVTRNIYPWGI